MPYPRLLVLVLAAALAPLAPLSAQHVVEGRVVAQANARPLEAVTVAVVSEGFLVGTDSTGAFRFEVPADRPGVALEITTIGFETFNRTFILPLDEPLAIGLERDAVELEGIDVEVERPRRTMQETLEFRVKSVQNGIPRTATAAELRAFEHQEAETWDFLRTMNVGVGAGCEQCIMASGRIPDPAFIVDDRRVSFDEFRSYPVGEVCRVDVVTIPIAFSPTEQGFVMAYTCAFLRDVATGRRSLPMLLTNMWGRES